MPLIVIEEDGEARKAKMEDYVEITKALLMHIPIGRVTTYGTIAKILDISPRLAGRLMALNDEGVIAPCHRVIKSDGSLGGYSGRGGREFKRKILSFEGIEFTSKDKIKLEYILRKII